MKTGHLANNNKKTKPFPIRRSWIYFQCLIERHLFSSSSVRETTRTQKHARRILVYMFDFLPIDKCGRWSQGWCISVTQSKQISRIYSQFSPVSHSTGRNKLSFGLLVDRFVGSYLNKISNNSTQLNSIEAFRIFECFSIRWINRWNGNFG